MSLLPKENFISDLQGTNGIFAAEFHANDYKHPNFQAKPGWNPKAFYTNIWVKRTRDLPPHVRCAFPT